MEVIAKSEELVDEEQDQTLECVPKEETEDVPEVEVIDTTCPHCGLDTTSPKLDISDSDRDEWTRHILSGGARRFSKEYSLYGGKVMFTLRTRTGLEDRDVDLATAELTKTITSIADFSKIRIEMLKLQLVYALDTITYLDEENPVNSRRVPNTAPSEDDIKAKWAVGKNAAIDKFTDVLLENSAAVVSLIADRLVNFNMLTSVLTLEGMSPDF